MNLERRIFYKLYLYCNIVVVLGYLYFGTIGGDLRGYVITSPMLLIVSLVVTVTMLYFICAVLYPIMSKVNIKPIIHINRYFVLDIIILIVNVSHGVFSIAYDVGLAGISISSDVPKIPLYLSIVIQPTFLLYIYLAFTGDKKRKLLIVNAGVILLVSLLKGWLSSVMYLTFIAVMIYRDFFIREKVKFLIIASLGVILSPFFRFMKAVSSAVNGSESNISYIEAVGAVINYREINSISDFLNTYLFSVVERFEHVGILYYVMVDDKVRYLFNDYNVTPFFAEGWIQNRLYSSFSSLNNVDMQFLLAEMIYPYVRWRVNTTLPVWLYVDANNILLLISYVLFLMFICILLSKLISTRVVNLSWLATLVMLHHGWFYSYSLYIQALMVFAIMLVILRVARML
ncbi:oligosaccharide repeat unit polymerase [Thaumasiovibrio sp. DFM-14]|uniref:oligosaccharide repeat unit polymerase n=1 Tax=Thaumasiovibrio sp. DFM-14 TaxID=3384792 RepID=UPI0039A24F75